MIIYLMRHADAISPSFWTENDRTRPLTDLAQAQLMGAGQAMKRLQFCPNEILSSPYERAKETAHLLFEAMPNKSPTLLEDLACGARFQDYRNVLKSLNNKEQVLIVGHMPDVAIASSGLTGIAHLMEERFQPGDMVAIEISSPEQRDQGKVLWKRKLDEWKRL